MNINDIENYRYTKGELKIWAYRSEDLRQKIAAIQKNPKSSFISSDTLSEHLAMITAHCDSIHQSRKEVVSFIEGIEDEYTQKIIYWHYIQGYTWDNVSAKLGGYASADCVKITAHRYIKSSVACSVYTDNVI